MHWIYAHLIGDFILQNDWMASGKKNSWLVAAIHVIVYLVPFLFTGMAFWKIGIIGLQHLLQDRTNFVTKYLEIIGKKDFTKPPLAPWSIFLVDNIIHSIDSIHLIKTMKG